ncbi:MAG: hypothetical protein H6995_00905 [Pseudomonadales bacterium]|nr:hypothetical protein [Pseudomonadales bacterium]MCP5213556.1 hypothetical protein [Pseudomonadales bacterium]
MAISYDIDPKSNIVFVRIYDVINIRDIKETLDEVQNDPNVASKITALIDAREIRRAFFVREMDALVEVFAGQTAAFVERYAFIIGNDIAMGVGRKFHIKAMRAGLKLAIFRDHAAALGWFRKEAETCA